MKKEKNRITTTIDINNTTHFKEENVQDSQNTSKKCSADSLHFEMLLQNQTTTIRIHI